MAESFVLFLSWTKNTKEFYIFISSAKSRSLMETKNILKAYIFFLQFSMIIWAIWGHSHRFVLSSGLYCGSSLKDTNPMFTFLYIVIQEHGHFSGGVYIYNLLCQVVHNNLSSKPLGDLNLKRHQNILASSTYICDWIGWTLTVHDMPYLYL